MLELSLKKFGIVFKNKFKKRNFKIYQKILYKTNIVSNISKDKYFPLNLQ